MENIDWRENLEHRKINDQTPSHALILSAPSDLGVIRNGGRRGTRLGPTAIFKKLEKMIFGRGKPEYHQLISLDHNKAPETFDEEQVQEEQQIQKVFNLSQNQKLVHLGGGHDHVYPLLKVLNKRHQRIAVINLDAHLDTRTDPVFHSGTPFRQFSDGIEHDNFLLLQIGTQHEANSEANYTPLKHGVMRVIPREYESRTEMLKTVINEELAKFSPDFLLLSLDCDALHHSECSAVSAVNHDGLSLTLVKDLILTYKRVLGLDTALGIYEFNPIFDNQSGANAKTIAGLIKNYLED